MITKAAANFGAGIASRHPYCDFLFCLTVIVYKSSPDGFSANPILILDMQQKPALKKDWLIQLTLWVAYK